MSRLDNVLNVATPTHCVIKNVRYFRALQEWSVDFYL